MEASPQAADGKASDALIGGYERHGELEQAVTLVEQAYGFAPAGGRDVVKAGRCLPRGQHLEMEPVDQLLRALAHRGLMKQLGDPLLERLRAANVPMSGRLFSSVLGGGSADGGVEELDMDAIWEADQAARLAAEATKGETRPACGGVKSPARAPAIPVATSTMTAASSAVDDVSELIGAMSLDEARRRHAGRAN